MEGEVKRRRRTENQQQLQTQQLKKAAEMEEGKERKEKGELRDGVVVVVGKPTNFAKYL